MHSQHPAALETGCPIKYGASISHALQTLRLLDPADERMLDAALAKGEAVSLILKPASTCAAVDIRAAFLRVRPDRRRRAAG